MSHDKCLKLGTSPNQLDDHQLEVWDSLQTRFSRASDLFLSRYIRAMVLVDDPAFRGTFRDFLNQAEKQKIISDVNIWMAIRELRNRLTHEYEEDDLEALFHAMMKESPHLLGLISQLKAKHKLT